MLDIDIDAFYLEQDQRMNEPEDGYDEFIARMATSRRYPLISMPYPSHVENSSVLSHEKTVLDTVPGTAHVEVQSNDSIPLISAKRKELPSNPGSQLNVKRSKAKAIGAQDPTTRPTSPTLIRSSPRRFNSAPLRISPPPSVVELPSNPNSAPMLKRKQSPTEPDKPVRKKLAIEPSSRPLPPIEEPR
ncbi:hypothetical protein B0H10DRAFT_567062 [Mycena sp. CBHHK59/15]|nr:hypothetical protein B0H10DRAFT_567062 [Mycena sp. CBHHK59/15]